jgi:hypothetical protein
VPLAVACRARPRAWCRVPAEPFEARRLRTMALLAARTDLAWRHRRKTVLHFAVDEGPAALGALLDALDVAADPGRDDRYLYTDREGIVHSVSRYITHLWDPEGKSPDAEPMVRLLRQKGRLKDRMYRPEKPGEGVEQPEGVCGMPADLALRWGLST